MAIARIPAGDSGTLATVAHMRRFVRRGVMYPLTVQLAGLIVEGAGEYRPAQARALRSWLDHNTRFLPDPHGPELLRSVPEMLEMLRARGWVLADCDDIAILGAALGKAVGFPARFTLLGFHHPGLPFRHIYSELFDGQRWVDLDVTRPSQPIAPVKRVLHVNI